MSEIQKTYRDIIKKLGSDIDDENLRLANAGIATAIAVLKDGSIRIQDLKKRIPDFTQSEIRIALARLRKNGYFSATIISRPSLHAHINYLISSLKTI